MKSKKLLKPTKKDLARQEKIEKKIKNEEVKLNHPKGKERFVQTLQNVSKKKIL